MNQTAGLLLGLFFAFGMRAVTTPLSWWLNRRHGWQAPVNQKRQQCENAKTVIRYGRGGAPWFMAFYLAA